LASTPNLAENLQHHAIKGVVRADYPDVIGKVVEVGSVSGGSLITSITTGWLKCWSIASPTEA
jgi:hypothetical protein